jgi:ectoine hydroxylase-related dioxygenase (phytanoyl-CoA dioxygenase family)
MTLEHACTYYHGLRYPWCRQVVRCAISAGDVVLMDSRLLHCAGANLAGPRRRLLYFTVVDGGGKPLPSDAMSSMSMFEVYRDKLRLDNREDWPAHASSDGFARTGFDVFSGY